MQSLISSICLVNKSSFGLWFSHYVRLFETLWTVACQTPLSMGISRQEYWSGLPFPSPGDHPNPGIEPGSPALWADSRVPLSMENALSFRSQHICHLLQLTQITLNYYLNYYLKIPIIVLVMCVCVCAQSCLPLCDPMDYSPPGSSVHGIFQARILEWVAISYSRGSSRPRDQTCVLASQFFTTALIILCCNFYFHFLFF